jgi:hypothetical protein
MTRVSISGYADSAASPLQGLQYLPLHPTRVDTLGFAVAPLQGFWTGLAYWRSPLGFVENTAY